MAQIICRRNASLSFGPPKIYHLSD
jgi:hypothetical protein